MSRRQVIVDGSNLATEGRSLPSLEQLDQAVREFIAENPDDQVTVVVDASFGHRIDPLELPIFEEAEAAGEVVSPPAGAIGRGDAFLLRIAQKTGATVLSNDSFQEFHAEHAWLFDKGRLVGGKPVPGVGWIFMDRTPVRGPKSREVVKEARRRKEAPSGDTRIDEQGALGEGGGQAPARSVDQRAKASSAVKGRLRSVDRAIETAKAEVVEPSSRPSLRRRALPPSDPVNEPLAFITFIASHPLGSVVEGLVFEYSSHGAFVEADGARCYVPLSAMGDPAPRRAREVMAKGETLPFVVQALDPQRRGIELALPGNERVAGSPTAETVEAEIGNEPEPDDGDGVDSPEASVPADAVPADAVPRARKTSGVRKTPGVRKATRARKDATPAAAGTPVPSPEAELPTPESAQGEPPIGQDSPGEPPAAKTPTRRRAPARKAALGEPVAVEERPAVAKRGEAVKAAKSAKPADPAKPAGPAKLADLAKAADPAKAAEPSKLSKAAAPRRVVRRVPGTTELSAPVDKGPSAPPAKAARARKAVPAIADPVATESVTAKGPPARKAAAAKAAAAVKASRVAKTTAAAKKTAGVAKARATTKSSEARSVR